MRTKTLSGVTQEYVHFAAAYDPKLGMGAGGLTLAIAAVFNKGWRWWVVGIVILAVALFFYWDDQTSAELRSGQKE